MATAWWSRHAGTLVRSAGALGAIGLETFLCALLLRLSPTTVALVYLVTTLIIATRWGLAEAVVASLFATPLYNFFFLPPFHTFRIADPQNWIALFAFLLASLVSSRLSERARRRAAEALSRQRELEQLHAVSRAIVLGAEGQSLSGQLAAQIAEAYGAGSVAIYDRQTDETVTAGSGDLSDDLRRKLREAALYGGTFRDEGQGEIVTAFGLEGKPVGSLALTGTEVSPGGLESLTNLVALGLEKARHRETANRAEAARQTQEFKSTLLDALAHEFKTPLTTIQAAASGMLASGAEPEQQHEFAAIIGQEADRLTTLVTEAIHLSHIEAGRIRLEKKPCHVRALIEAVLVKMEANLEGRPLDLSVAQGLPAIEVDGDLMEIVLRQLIDNAVKYSFPNSPVRVRATQSGGFVWISVWNDGLPVPQREKTRLFEKFYRGTTAGRQSTGTGMGLSIARDIMSAHGGEVRLESSPEQGTEFTVLVPVSARSAQA
jgi:two-component system sensor histidine kinase KdpD